MIKRVMPYTKPEWTNSIKEYIECYEFWPDGIEDEFEDKIRKMYDRKYALTVNSATNAIFMCLYAQKSMYPHRNEVILPNYGYPAAVRACKMLNLEVIPIDCDISGMSPKDISDNITSRTLAVIHIENNGVIGNIDEIKRSVKGGYSFDELFYEEILFIEDSAPSMLQEWMGRKAGTFGDVSIFSFSATKPLLAGEGGVILMDDEVLFNMLCDIRHSDYESTSPSLNFRLSPFLIAYLMPQLDNLHIVAALRTTIHLWYSFNLEIFTEYAVTKNYGAVMYISDKAEQISKKLNTFGIEHRYKYYPLCSDDPCFEKSIKLRNSIIDLPLHHKLTDKQVQSICTIIERAENG
jgi:dTDP-4-amino-4,6-dideoxygalactose transaminase